MFCFASTVLPPLNIFLVFLLSQVPSGLFPRDVFLVLLVELIFFFSSQHVSAFFLCLVFFACCRRFLISVSCRISYPGFEFLLVFFRETPILSLTNFSPALISSFNSMMFFFEIYVNNSFIFFNFYLDCFPVFGFFSDIILFKISIFISSSASVYCVLFEWVTFRLLFLCGSFRLECSCFSVFSVLIIVLGSCCLDSLFIFWCISNISWSETNFSLRSS